MAKPQKAIMVFGKKINLHAWQAIMNSKLCIIYFCGLRRRKQEIEKQNPNTISFLATHYFLFFATQPRIRNSLSGTEDYANEKPHRTYSSIAYQIRIHIIHTAEVLGAFSLLQSHNYYLKRNLGSTLANINNTSIYYAGWLPTVKNSPSNVSFI